MDKLEEFQQKFKSYYSPLHDEYAAYMSMAEGSPVRAKASNLDQALKMACNGLKVTPKEVYKALSKEDLEDWEKGDLSQEELIGFAKNLVK